MEKSEITKLYRALDNFIADMPHDEFQSHREALTEVKTLLHQAERRAGKIYELHCLYKGNPVGFRSPLMTLDKLNDYKRKYLESDLSRCEYIEVWEEGKNEPVERYTSL